MKLLCNRFFPILMIVAMLLSGSALAEGAVTLSPDNPQTVTVWHYYNGVQQQEFDALVLAFNETVGTEQGIIIEAMSQGSVNDLTDKLMASANQEPGAAVMPDMFAAYADTAFAVNNMGLVADLTPYMTQEEYDAYMDSYMREGQLDEEGTLKVFPIAKSTELLLLNETDWAPFAEATGADKALLSTWEGIVELSRMYYEYTDGLTEEPNDGKAFFGRDSFANYMFIGSLQLGAEMFEVKDGTMTLHVDEAIMRRLWDNFYVPYVSGWFGAYGRFRSDDIKTGQLIALVGSTSGALYFPTEVTLDDGTAYPIECGAYTLPNFADTQPCAVQQGAGMVVTASTPEKEYAATVFLKWFTDAKNNISFALNSGYLPVKKEANDPAVLTAAMDAAGVSETVRSIVDVGVGITSTYQLYTNNAFANGYEARQVVGDSMMNTANAAVAKRDELMAGGMTREEALAQLTDDAAFTAWLESFNADLNAALAQ